MPSLFQGHLLRGLLALSTATAACLGANGPYPTRYTTPPQSPLAEITAQLEDSSKAYVEYAPMFWNPNATILLDAVFSPVSNADYGKHVWKGQWQKMTHALTASGEQKSPYAVQLNFISDATRRVVWQEQQPIDPVPLAEASAKLVPDQFIRTHFDLDAVHHFRVSAAHLSPGAYRVMMTFLAPDSSTHRFPGASDVAQAPYLIIRPTPLNIANLTLPSRVSDSPTLRTKAVFITKPGLKQFPKDDPNDCQARSIGCLTSFQNRVYIGYGDWDKNRGPIDLWSFAPETSDPAAGERYPGRYAFRAGENPVLLFTHEYTVQEEEIASYRICGDRLFLPGIDGNKEFGPDGIVFGSIYIREKGSWRKMSTLPRVWHVMDVIALERRLFALTVPQGLLVSADDGLTWKAFSPPQMKFGASAFARWHNGLLFFGEGLGGTLYRKGKCASFLFEQTPGAEAAGPSHAVSFREGLVYTTGHKVWSPEQRQPLFVLTDLTTGPRRVELFNDKRVCDLCVQDGVLYALTARLEGMGFIGEVYATPDLRHWTREAVFPADALPNAFALLDGAFYVGLGNRGYDAATYQPHGEEQYAFADKAAGSLLRIERSDVLTPQK